MNSTQIIRTVFEIGIVVLAIWAVFHEDMFIAIEERIASSFRRRRFRVIRSNTYR